MEKTNDSVVDKITTYAVDNVTLDDSIDKQDLFYFEIVPDSDATVEIPDASDAIKINLI